MYIIMTKEKIERAKSLRLNGLSPKEISKIMNCKVRTIYKYTANLGVKPCHPLYKMESIQHDFFSAENIDVDPARLILVGFIAADGCVSRKTATSQKYLVIRLCHKDSNVLHIFNKLLAKDTRTISKSAVSQAVDFTSNQMCDDLARYGIVQRKTAIFTWPKNITIEQAKYFLLGYFYGDGCYHSYKNRDVINIICTQKFALGLRRMLYKYKIVDHCVVSILKRNNNYAQVVFQGKHCKKLSAWLFSDLSIPLLPRKHPVAISP